MRRPTPNLLLMLVSVVALAGLMSFLFLVENPFAPQSVSGTTTTTTAAPTTTTVDASTTTAAPTTTTSPTTTVDASTTTEAPTTTTVDASTTTAAPTATTVDASTTTAAPTTTTTSTTMVGQPPNPGNSKNCSDFTSQAAAQSWYDTYFPYYDDVAGIDADNDGVACGHLP